MFRTSASAAIIATIALIALAPPLAAQTRRIGREQTLQRSVVSGQTVRVFSYASFGKDCTGRQPPQVVIRSQPAHGTVSVQPGPSTVRIVRNDAADCGGQTYPGTVVYYTAQAGFHGVDQFDYDIVSANRSDHDTAIVEVR